MSAQEQSASPPMESTIPPEIWLQILSLLKKPIPRPLSYPHRSSLRQRDICSAARVSKLFNTLVQPLLYTEIVTDDLPSLFANMHTPRSQQRLKNTRALFIEYSLKGSEPSYLDLFEDGKASWPKFGRTPAEAEKAQEPDCQRELKALWRCLKDLKSMDPQRLKAVFSKLESIAVSSIYGEDMSWTPVPAQKRMGQQVSDCIDLFHEFRATIGVPNFCARQIISPLGPASRSSPSSESSLGNSSTIVHFSNDFHLLPLLVGSPIIWVSDSPPNENWGPLFYKVCEALAYYTIERKQNVGVPRDKLIADLTIYCSTDHIAQDSTTNPENSSVALIMSELGDKLAATANDSGWSVAREDQRSILDKRSPQYEKAIREASGISADSIKWKISADAPICPCCGSGPPR